MNLSLSYFVMVVGILSAKLLGFVRELVVANRFGTSQLTDIYFQVFSVANVVFASLGVALSTFLVKSINIYRNNSKNEKGYIASFYKKAILWSFCGIGILCVLGYPITKMLLQGLSKDDFLVALKLYYIMIPSFLFIVLTYTSSGILQNKGKFFRTAIVSVPFNMIIIGSLLSFVDSIYTFGIVTTIGWASQFLFLLPAVLKDGYKLWLKKKNEVDLSDIKISEILFIFVSNVIFQFLFIIDKSFASYIEGASSAIHYSSNLFTTVSSVFLVGMSAVFFPSLTKSIGEKDNKKTNSLIRYTLIFMFCIFIPFLIITTLYHNQIIALLYERGSFDASSTAVVAKAFFVYAFCILGYITQELLFKIFFAKGKYILTVVSSATIILINLICDFAFRNNVNMIIISTAVLSAFFAIFMFTVLGRMAKNLYNRDFFENILKIIISSLPFIPIYMIFKSMINENKLYFLIPLLISSLVYFTLLYFFKVLNIIFRKD